MLNFKRTIRHIISFLSETKAVVLGIEFLEGVKFRPID